MEDIEDVIEKIRNDPDDEIDNDLIEKFITGDLYSFDGLVRNGELIWELPLTYTEPVMKFSQDGKPKGSTSSLFFLGEVWLSRLF